MYRILVVVCLFSVFIREEADSRTTIVLPIASITPLQFTPFSIWNIVISVHAWILIANCIWLWVLPEDQKQYTRTRTHTINYYVRYATGRCTNTYTDSYTLSTLQFKRNLNGSYKGMCEKERMRWRESAAEWKSVSPALDVFIFIRYLCNEWAVYPLRFSSIPWSIFNLYQNMSLLCVTECNMREKKNRMYNIVWSTRILNTNEWAHECTYSCTAKSTDRNHRDQNIPQNLK